MSLIEIINDKSIEQEQFFIDKHRNNKKSKEIEFNNNEEKNEVTILQYK